MDKETEKLCEIFKELTKFKDQMNPKIYQDIRYRLTEGSNIRKMYDYMINEKRKLLDEIREKKFLGLN